MNTKQDKGERECCTNYLYFEDDKSRYCHMHYKQAQVKSLLTKTDDQK